MSHQLPVDEQLEPDQQLDDRGHPPPDIPPGPRPDEPPPRRPPASAPPAASADVDERPPRPRAPHQPAHDDRDETRSTTTSPPPKPRVDAGPQQQPDNPGARSSSRRARARPARRYVSP